VESGEGWIRHAEEGHFGQEKVLSRPEQILPALEDLPFAVEVSAGD
jgi:hypothetical protein